MIERYLIFTLLPLLSGCFVDVTIATHDQSSHDYTPAPSELILSETVRTTVGTPNYSITASFYDFAENKRTTSGYSIHGVWK